MRVDYGTKRHSRPVETSLHPVTGLSIDGSLSYLDFKYKSFGSDTSGSTTVSLSGPTNLNGPQFGDYPPLRRGGNGAWMRSTRPSSAR